MTIIHREGFESGRDGYITSVEEFTDGAGDFFTRTDGSNVGDFYEIAGIEGTTWFAAMDLDGDGAAPVQTLTIEDIPVAGFANLSFSGLFAEDDDGTNQDWDDADYVLVEARLDGGDWLSVLQFAGIDNGTIFNQEPAVDSDFDGVGDGDALSDVLSRFSAPIAGTGSLLDLRLTLALDSGDEDISFDDLTIEGEPTETIVLDETFDDASRFVTSTPFFSDAGTSSGFDFFGLSDGVGGGDFGGDPAPSGVKAYGGADGSFLTGMDLDGEGATLPITVSWNGLDIDGLSNISFSGDLAEFLDDAGDIDAADKIRLVARIDGGPEQVLLDFRGADFSSSASPSNGIFRQDTDFDGVGDGAALGDVLQTFTADIVGTGSTLDLILEVSVNSGDEDFAVDNFRVTGTSGGEIAASVIASSGDGLAVDENGATTDTFTLRLSTDPTDPVTVTVSPDAQTEVSVNGGAFSENVDVVLTGTDEVTVTVRAIDDDVDEFQPPCRRDLVRRGERRSDL